MTKWVSDRKKGDVYAVFSCLVPGMGLEPTRPCGHQLLRLARLPFRQPGREAVGIVPETGFGGGGSYDSVSITLGPARVIGRLSPLRYLWGNAAGPTAPYHQSSCGFQIASARRMDGRSSIPPHDATRYHRPDSAMNLRICRHWTRARGGDVMRIGHEPRQWQRRSLRCGTPAR